MDLEKLVDSKLSKTYKICLIGAKEVGKTSILVRLLNNNFNEKYFPTKKLITYETFHNFNNSTIEEDKLSCIELLDTASYKKGKDLTDLSSLLEGTCSIKKQNISAFIFVFNVKDDLSKANSFKEVN